RPQDSLATTLIALALASVGLLASSLDLDNIALACSYPSRPCPRISQNQTSAPTNRNPISVAGTPSVRWLHLSAARRLSCSDSKRMNQIPCCGPCTFDPASSAKVTKYSAW